MGDKLNLRKQIKEIFEKAGAEVALYEKDLTPSINPNTYRNDILQTDFVVFIIDERYGAKTNSGLSGTEEEFTIVQYNKMPCHVYLKQIDKTNEAENFEKLIRSKGISYYYYKSENDLKKKLQSTCFTIASEIITSNIDKQHLDPMLVRKMAINHDIEMGKAFCQLMDVAIDINNKTQFNFLLSNLMIQALDEASMSILSESKSIFIDKKCDELLRTVCEQISTFNKQMSNDSVPGINSTPVESIAGTLFLSINQWVPNINFGWYESQLQSIMMTYGNYKNYLAQILLEGELCVA